MNWISVKDSMPDPDAIDFHNYLVIDTEGKINIASMHYDGFWAEYGLDEITHWMNLKDIPKP